MRLGRVSVAAIYKAGQKEQKIHIKLRIPSEKEVDI